MPRACRSARAARLLDLCRPLQQPPSLLSKGNRSTTESDQRRALMMPQELIQMPANKLIVLRAGTPPIQGRKLVYWREKAFARRVLPPPTVPFHAGFGRTDDVTAKPAPLNTAGPVSTKDPLTLDLVMPGLEAAGLEPLPEHGASDEAVEAWVERFIDASARPALQEADHAR